MPVLQIPHDQRQVMIAYAQAALPNEVCGLLVGLNAQVTQIIPIENQATDPLHSFEMEPIALLRALKQIDAEALELVGVFHSHPKTEPIPSQRDIVAAQLNYPHIAHVIIGLKQERPRIQAWQIQPTRIEAIELNTEQVFSKSYPLVRAERYAIVFAALLAFVVMLSLSFALLPPAPMITPVAP